jgi:hypothetical protein
MTFFAPALTNFSTISPFVDTGTTTVHGKPRVLAAQTAASPAFPPDDAKKCTRFPALDGLCRCERIWAPIARDLKEPLGWVFSSFRRIVQPASVERGVLFIRGVGIQGFLYVGVSDGEEEGFERCD